MFGRGGKREWGARHAHEGKRYWERRRCGENGRGGLGGLGGRFLLYISGGWKDEIRAITREEEEREGGEAGDDSGNPECPPPLGFREAAYKDWADYGAQCRDAGHKTDYPSTLLCIVEKIRI